MQLGHKIKKLRELRNLRQEYVADQLHMSQACYSKMENGHTKISVERLGRIAEVLNVSLEDILHFDEQAALTISSTTPTPNTAFDPVPASSAEKQLYETYLKRLQQENVRLKKELDNFRM